MKLSDSVTLVIESDNFLQASAIEAMGKRDAPANGQTNASGVRSNRCNEGVNR
jgi:hypothetical protein